MLEIRQINEQDYQLIVKWNEGKDKDYLNQWAGSKIYQYPITIDQIKEHDKDKASQIYIIFFESNPIGSVELDRINIENSSANACRFIISDNNLNKGYGTLALKQLVKIAFTEMGLNRLTLSVFCYNIGALRCYEKVGFFVKEYNKREDPNWNSYVMEIKN